MKLPFASDYMHLCHPELLRRMQLTANDAFPGYGADELCLSAKEKIRKAIDCPEAEIHFLIGGTQTNVVAIDALIQPYQGVMAAESGHINVHEAGAVEATGHKVLTLPHHGGKVATQDVERYLTSFYSDHAWEHSVQPALLYITHPTELGTLYTLQELTALSDLCHAHDVRLYLDGARLGYGLSATGTDITLPDIARLCDAFYIGGTKVGALMGEALVFPAPTIVSHVFTQIKRHNSLLAKGWAIGMQFDALFTDQLYFNIARHAILMAQRLKDGLRSKGIALYADSPTNQQFVVLQDAQAERLMEHVACEVWAHLPNGQKAVRLCTSWHTTEQEVDQLLSLL
ncbi:MAG: low specificity L-threonine aldolase [Bacteroidaceae bacterium]|nr:low specificity L-threonine aldolase [Bacteroidaceae bacterium]